MKYISVAEMAKKWNISERSVRNYCANGKIPDAFLTGKTWNIPETAAKPERINRHSNTPQTLLEVLKAACCPTSRHDTFLKQTQSA